LEPSIDIRWVKCWYQDRDPRFAQHSLGLVPELLLHDPTLVTVSEQWGRNYVREPVIDADDLLPIDLPKNFTQQVYLLVDVGPECEREDHHLDLAVTVDGYVIELPIRIDVLPFDLLPSPIVNSLYYRAALFSAGSLKVTTPRDRYEADLRNMVTHGCTHPNCFEDLVVLGETEEGCDQFAEVLRTRADCGVSNDPLYLAVTGVPWATPARRDYYYELWQRLLSVTKGFGIETVYALGYDEPKKADLQKQVCAWQMAHEVGLKVLCASGNQPQHTYDLVGGLLDLPLFTMPDDPLSALWHGEGTKVGRYGPTSVERPDSHHRRRFGLEALRLGYGVVAPYAYQHQFGKTWWNDVDHRYKDHHYVYPTESGPPIDTPQWEGYREGWTDRRYAARLLALGGTVPDERGQNLDVVRAEMIERILTLSTR